MIYKTGKTRWLLVAGAITLATIAVAADNDANRFYVGADVGPAFAEDVNISAGDEIKFNPGVRGDVNLGYHFTPWIASEFGMGVVWNSVDSIGGVKMSSYGGSMDLYQIPLMGNVVLTAPDLGRFRPYVGGGIGCVFGKLDFNSPLGDIHDTDHTFSYQALAGLNYQITEHCEVGLGYRYLCTFNHAWTESGVTLDTGGTATHSVICSLTWKF